MRSPRAVARILYAGAAMAIGVGATWPPFPLGPGGNELATPLPYLGAACTGAALTTLLLVRFRLPIWAERMLSLAAMAPALLAAQMLVAVVGWGLATVLVVAAASSAAAAWLPTSGGGQAPDLSKELPEAWWTLERSREKWSWILALVVIGVTMLDRRQNPTALHLASLLALAVSAFNMTLFHWLPDVGEPKNRIVWHLAFLSLSLGLMHGSLHGPVSYLLLVPLVVVPTLAAQSLGSAVGWRVLALAAVLSGLSGLGHALREGLTIWPSVGHAIAEAMVVTLAAAIGIRNAGRQHRVMARMQVEVRDREQAELALRRSEARFAGILASAPDAIITADPAGRILQYNQSAAQIFGYDDSEVLGEHLRMLLPDESGEGDGGAAHGHMATGRLSARGRRKDGSAFPAEVNLSQMEFDDERVLTVMVRDVTDRARAVNLLRESEERFRSAFGSAATGMALVLPDGRFLQVNRSMCQTLGYGETELLTMSLSDILHEEDLAHTLSLFAQLMSGSLPWYQIEKRCCHKLGHTVWGRVSLAAVRDPGGAAKYAVFQLQDVTDRKRFEDQVVYLASHDHLTGLLNLRRLQDELERELRLLQRYENCGALVLINLKDFKALNDTLGYHAGDQVLSAVAARLQECLRSSDTVARVGGDDFVVFLPQIDTDDAQRRAWELVNSISRSPIETDKRPARVTARAGIALFPAHGASAQELLAKASLAVSYAKEVSHGDVELFRSETGWQAQMSSRFLWEYRVHEALVNDQFVLHAQPILDLRSGDIRRHELLLRLPDSNGQMILPGDFLTAVDRSGLIRDLDRWVVQRAIHMLRDLQLNGPHLQLEVNLSGRALADTDLFNLIRHTLNANQVNPSTLVLEITESDAIANMNEAQGFIHNLKKLGCQFALDDFGTGYSSFYHLKHLPVDYLKLDGSFVQNLSRDPVDQHLVKAMADVARGLGKQTIAEFVGDDETIRLLRSYGVDYAQGYHIGHPVPLILHPSDIRKP